MKQKTDLSRKIVSRQRTSSYDRVADSGHLDGNNKLKLGSNYLHKQARNINGSLSNCQ